MNNKKQKITLQDRIDGLKEQLKKLEITHFKIQGAIEMLEGMKAEGEE